MAISYEETAVAFAQQMLRAQEAEAQVKKLQQELEALKNDTKRISDKRIPE